MANGPILLWREGDWRCELHTPEIRGECRLLVVRGESVVTAESIHLGAGVYDRAEILRQRVLRGDLRAPE